MGTFELGPTVNTQSISSWDVLLHPYLKAASVRAEQYELDRLAKALIMPTVTKAVNTSHIDSRDREDAVSRSIVQILSRLQDAKASDASAPIASFTGYVSSTTHRVCIDILRERNPVRSSVRNRLRYIFRRDRGMSTWIDDNGRSVVGIDAWRGDRRRVPDAERLKQLLADPAGIASAVAAIGCHSDDWSGSAWAKLAEWLKGPIPFETLVGVAMAATGMPDQVQDAAGAYDDVIDRSPDPDMDVAGFVCRRHYLRWLWSEILCLPRQQRVVLLLNLRDPAGMGLIDLFPMLAVASVNEIAAALEMPIQQLAELWNDLPIADNDIATILGVERQTVINCRQSARKRLCRRDGMEGSYQYA